MIQFIKESDIATLNISPNTCIDWVTLSFKMKYEAQLPAKMSVHPHGIDFYTTMPCLLPLEYNRFGVKIVSRIKGRVPTLRSELFLYNAESGDLLAMVDSNWITAMRTGAVAALATKVLQSSSAKIYAFMGLGAIAHATMKCLDTILIDRKNTIIKLLRYKHQAEDFLKAFQYTQLNFQIVDSVEELIQDSDVVYSAITETTSILCEREEVFKPGVLVVPIHTRGFQNCDLFFDKVFADDTEHVRQFKYFNRFRYFQELSKVLLGVDKGRTSDTERILSYNIGLGLHDVFFASNIYNLLNK